MTAAEEQLVAELAEALRPAEPWPGAPSPEVVAARIAPAVQKWAAADRRRAVAEALRETAFGLDNCADEQSGWCGPFHDYADGLRARADAVEGGGR